MIGWLISLVATSLGLVMLWLYGNRSRWAPIVGFAVYSCWVIYDVKYEQWPLLLPTTVSIIVTIRNFKAMNDGH